MGVTLTVQYANELRKAGILVNAADPGFVDTDINNHTGYLTTARGAAVVVRLARLGAGGPTGGFFSERGPLLGSGQVSRPRSTRRRPHPSGAASAPHVKYAQWAR